MIVAIIGASNKTDRYSYKAQEALSNAGHMVIPVNPVVSNINGVACVATIGDIKEAVDTVTMYVRPDVSDKMANDLINLKPKRVIFNPGTENDKLEALLRENGIRTARACTIVMVKSNQFTDQQA